MNVVDVVSFSTRDLIDLLMDHGAIPSHICEAMADHYQKLGTNTASTMLFQRYQKLEQNCREAAVSFRKASI